MLNKLVIWFLFLPSLSSRLIPALLKWPALEAAVATTGVVDGVVAVEAAEVSLLPTLLPSATTAVGKEEKYSLPYKKNKTKQQNKTKSQIEYF